MKEGNFITSPQRENKVNIILSTIKQNKIINNIIIYILFRYKYNNHHCLVLLTIILFIYLFCQTRGIVKM